MRTVTLREVLEPRNDIVHPRDNPSGNGIFVGLEHIEPHTGRRIGSLPIRLEELTGRKARFFEGDIVYGYLRPYLNKVWVADFDGYCSVDQYVFRTGRGASPEFLAAFMRSPMFLSRAPIEETPGQLPRIRLDEVLGVQTPLPAIAEQDVFVSRLQANEASLNDLRSRSAGARDHVETLRGSIAEACLTDAAGRPWTTKPLGDVLVRPMRTGLSGQETRTGGMRGLSIAAVRAGVLDLSATKQVDVAADTDRLVREGAVYIVRGNGRLDLVGRCGVAPKPAAPVVFPDLLIEAQPDPSIVNPVYLAAAWETRTTRRAIEASARTSAGIHKVNLDGLSRVQVPVPPVTEQRRIAAELRERLATIDAMTRAIETQLAAIDALPAALLRRAFAEIEAA